MKRLYDVSILEGLMWGTKPIPDITPSEPVQYNISGQWEPLARGDPWYAGDSDAEYMQRIKACFKQAYTYLQEHHHPRTTADWDKAVDALVPFRDPLAVDLVTAAFKEMEREYISTQN